MSLQDDFLAERARNLAKLRPDELPASKDDAEMCGMTCHLAGMGEEASFVCTRVARHSGSHVAHSASNTILCKWEQS